MKWRIKWFLSVLIAGSPTAWGNAEQMERFQREYPPAAKRLQQRLSRTRGKCRISLILPGQSKPARLDEVDFAFDHERELAYFRRKHLIDQEGQPPEELVHGAGKDGVFVLERLSSEAAFTVQSVGRSLKDFAVYNGVFAQFPKAPYSAFFELSLSDVLASKSCRITKAERVKQNGRNLVEIDYVLGAEGPKTETSAILDPDAGWVIRSAVMKPGGPKTVRPWTLEIEYGDLSGDRTILPRRVMIRDGSGGTRVCEFDEWRSESTPEAEFRMPFYGLPDLVAATNVPRNGVLTWLGMVAVGIAAVAFILRWIASRGTAVPQV